MKQHKLLIKPIWTIIGHILDSASASYEEGDSFIKKAILEFSKKSALGFDAAISVALKGDILNPLSLELDQSVRPVCFNISEDFVTDLFRLIQEVKDRCNAETAKKFIMEDFSDDFTLNSGDIKLSPYLIDKYGGAANYVERAYALFQRENIAYWAMRGDFYDDLFYTTSFYRSDLKNQYSSDELGFI